MVRFLSLVLVVGAFWAAAWPLRAEGKGDGSCSEQEMCCDATSQLVVVPCSVNGKVLRMILDTGATHTVLHRVAADSLPGLEYVDMSQVRLVGNARNNPVLVRGALEVGGRSFQECTMLCVDLSAVMGMFSEPADGILGMDVLSHLPFALDFVRGRVRWGEAVGKVDASFSPMRGEFDEAGRLFVELREGEWRERMLLDTGARVSVLPRRVWAAGAEGSVRAVRADVNEAVDERIELGKPAAVRLAEGVFSAEIKPVLKDRSMGHALLGLDALAGRVLVHLPSASGFGLFYVAPREGETP